MVRFLYNLFKKFFGILYYFFGAFSGTLETIFTNIQNTFINKLIMLTTISLKKPKLFKEKLSNFFEYLIHFKEKNHKKFYLIWFFYINLKIYNISNFYGIEMVLMLYLYLKFYRVNDNFNFKDYLFVFIFSLVGFFLVFIINTDEALFLVLYYLIILKILLVNRKLNTVCFENLIPNNDNNDLKKKIQIDYNRFFMLNGIEWVLKKGINFIIETAAKDPQLAAKINETIGVSVKKSFMFIEANKTLLHGILYSSAFGFSYNFCNTWYVKKQKDFLLLEKQNALEHFETLKVIKDYISFDKVQSAADDVLKSAENYRNFTPKTLKVSFFEYLDKQESNVEFLKAIDVCNNITDIINSVT